MHESNLRGAEKAQEFQFIIDTDDHLEAAKGKFFNKLEPHQPHLKERLCAPKQDTSAPLPAPPVSAAEIIKNTQDYMSGKNLPTKEDKRYFSHYNAAEMKQHWADSAFSSENNSQPLHLGPLPSERLSTNPKFFAQPEIVERKPKYTFRDGVNEALGIVGRLSQSAEPFLMWDLAKEHVRNLTGTYRRASHNDEIYGPPVYFRPIVPAPSPWLYVRPVLPPQYRNYAHGYGSYAPGYGGYDPGYGSYNPRYGGSSRFGGNYYPQDSDTNFMHAGPDGLTFSRSQQRVPRVAPPPAYSSPRGGNNGYSDYSSGNSINDALDLVNGLTGAAMPWLQWDVAKEYARNQREQYRNHR